MPKSSQYEDEGFEIITHEPKLTRLDKARHKCSELEAKHESLSSIENLSPDEVRLLAVVERQLAEARQRYALENKRAADDVFRRNEAIDEWRASEEGRLVYNAMRRTVRDKPNADLKGMTEAEKEQHRLDQKADNKWTNDKRRKGWPEDQIEAAFAIRLQERAAKRDRPAADPTTAMENLPDFGTF